MKHSTEQRSSAEWRSPLLRPLNEQTAIFASISQFTHLCNMQSNVLNDLAFKRLIGFFSPSNARWLSPARLSCRKYDCIVQIHQINAVATLVMMTMWVKREPELDRYGQLTGRGAQHFQCPSLRVECSLAASKACSIWASCCVTTSRWRKSLFNLPSPTAPPWFLWQGNFLWSEAKSRSIENTSLRRIARTMGLLFTKAAVVVLVVQLVSHNSMTDCRTMSGRHWLSSDTEGTESLSVHGGGQRRSTLPDSEQIGNVVSEIQAERH